MTKTRNVASGCRIWLVPVLGAVLGFAACSDDSSRQDAPPEPAVSPASRGDDSDVDDGDVEGVSGATWPGRRDPGVPASNLGALDGQAPYNQSDALPPLDPSDD